MNCCTKQTLLTSVVRTFNTTRCRICMKEGIAILEHSFDTSVKLMNARSEIHGSCRHKPVFHRFSTEEAIKAKKVGETNNLAVIEANILKRIRSPGYNNGIPENYRCIPILESIPTNILEV